MKLFFVIINTALFIPAILFGQSTLRGTVIDSSSHERIVGANVVVLNSSLGTATSIEGEYTITQIPSGKRQIKISCIGYEPEVREVDFANESVIQLNIALSPTILLGEEVVITAQMRGQMAAINQQLTSKSIVNVVSEERIQEMPDANAADAIGRLPGVSLIRSGGEASKVVLRGLSDKFSVVTIDGNRMAPTDANERGVDLSTISQGSLAGIELAKASTADKDADAIAGSVNLVTRKAPSTRLIRIEPRGSYNGMDKSASQYNFSGRYGERFIDDIFGIQMFGNIERTIRSNESTDLNYGDPTNKGNDYEITSFRPTYIHEIRKRGGGGMILDFDTPDGGSIRWNSTVNQTSRNYLTSYRTYPQIGNVTYNYREQETELSTFNSFLHGENNFVGIHVNWNVAFSQAKRNNPFDFEMNFIESSSKKDSAGNVISGMRNIPSNLFKGPVDQWIPFAWNNFQAADIDHANDNKLTNFDKEKSASLDLSRQYTLSDFLSGEIKLGSKYRQKSRYASFRQLRANYYLITWPVSWTKSGDGTVAAKDFSGTRFENLAFQSGRVLFSNFLDPNPETRAIYGKYALYPLINRDALKLWRQLNINGYLDNTGNDAEYKNNFEVEGDDYSVTERVLAGYAMNTLNIGPQISLIAGVRVEADDNDYTSKFTTKTISGFPFPIGELRDTNVFHKETVVLPNFHAIVRPYDFMTVRLAGYKMLARPDFNQRLLKYIASSITGLNTLRIGNPDLKNAVAWNYELQTQFHDNAIGLFSISAFYKDIKSMYHIINRVQFQGQQPLDSLNIPWKLSFPDPKAVYELIYPYNSSKPTKVWGFEVEHQTDFKFLPSFLSNIVLNYNFTIVRSETWVTSSTTVTDTILLPPINIKVPRTTIIPIEVKRKLEDQPEFFGNASLGYDIGDFSMRVSVFHQSSFNKSFSSDSRNDEVQDAYTRWDLAFKQGITENISVTLNLNNITNAQEGTTTVNRYHPEWNLPNANNKYGPTADLGVRVEL